MRKTIITYVSILLCMLNVFVAVFGLWYLFEGFESSSLYQWLDQCDTDLAVWCIAIIGVIIMVISVVCLTTSILMPYWYEHIYGFVEDLVYKQFPQKQTNIKEEPKISVTPNDIPKPLPEPKVEVEDPIVKTTIKDLEHVAEVIFAEVIAGDTYKPKVVSNSPSNKQFVRNFDDYFPMPDRTFYTWTFAIEGDCERIIKNMFKDEKRTYFYEKNPTDRENLLIGIKTTDNAWRVIRDENANTKRYDYCIYDYVEDKQYLLIDPLEVNMNGKDNDWENYYTLYRELGYLYNFYN